MFLVSENRGSYSGRTTYRVSAQLGLELVQEPEAAVIGLRGGGGQSRSFKSLLRSTRLTLRQVFLPNGYPSSVSRDYMAYQAWDTLQAFASSLSGALGTESVMRGVGVGSLEASPLAAAMTWILKQGTGMIGSILFAYAKGSSLDYDNKKWRLFADVLNDFATFIDLLAPLFPPHLIVLVFCASSLARSIVGVAGGATRASIRQHQARTHNSADVSAKDGSQETLVNLVSLSVCLLLLPAVSGNSTLIWFLFMLFTLIHIWSNHGAVRALQFESFNTSRLLLAIDQYLKLSNVPSIQDVNLKESVLLGFGIKDIDVCRYGIRLGTSFGDSVNTGMDGKDLDFLVQSSVSRSFIIIPNIEKKMISVVLGERISSEETVEAFTKSILIAHKLNTSHYTQKRLLIKSMMDVDKDWDRFRDLVYQAGYDLHKSTLKSGEYRAKWNYND